MTSADLQLSLCDFYTFAEMVEKDFGEASDYLTEVLLQPNDVLVSFAFRKIAYSACRQVA